MQALIQTDQVDHMMNTFIIADATYFFSYLLQDIGNIGINDALDRA